MRVLNVSVSICLAPLIIPADRHLVQALGGSLSLIIFFPALFFIGLYAELTKETTFLATAVLSVLVLNYFDFLQKVYDLGPEATFYGYNVIVLLLMLVLWHAYSPFTLRPGQRKGRPVTPWPKTRHILLSNLTFGFAYSLVLSVAFWAMSQLRPLSVLPLPMIGTCFLTIPVFFPILVNMLGYDPVWFGVVQVRMLEITGITPPLGMIAYIIAGSTKGLTPGAVFKGAVPFLLMELITLPIFIFVKPITMWLPGILMK